MSRSFKKSKIVKDSTKGMKRLANHRVRSYFKSVKKSVVVKAIGRFFVVMIFLTISLFVLITVISVKKIIVVLRKNN